MKLFWKKKPPGDTVSKTESKTESRGWQHQENLSTTTNAYICVQAFGGGVQEISVGAASAEIALDLFKKVRAEVRR